MKMPERYVHLSFQIDTNKINARRKLEYMNRLEHWYEDGVIFMEMSEVAQTEAATGNQRRREKAYGNIYSQTYATTAEEKEILKRIEVILFPSGATTQNDRNDVEIVFNAMKYGQILITNDGGSETQPGGILGNAEQLKVIGVTVLRDYEAVALVEDKIKKRDQFAREVAEYKGEALPEWVGKDL